MGSLKVLKLKTFLGPKTWDLCSKLNQLIIAFQLLKYETMLSLFLLDIFVLIYRSFSLFAYMCILGKKRKGKKNKGGDYGGPFGGGGLTTQNGAKSQPKPPTVIHDFVRDALNTKVHDIFNPSKARARARARARTPRAIKTSQPR